MAGYVYRVSYNAGKGNNRHYRWFKTQGYADRAIARARAEYPQNDPVLERVPAGTWEAQVLMEHPRHGRRWVWPSWAKGRRGWTTVDAST